uniref:Uncharacterized protein n=1 Tax=Arundo donax TaxID=35708 RepID=A0A0A9DQ17_ARUDO
MTTADRITKTVKIRGVQDRIMTTADRITKTAKIRGVQDRIIDNSG